ncbi:MAG: SAM-dependent methyltransferase [Polyangia bacterium]
MVQSLSCSPGSGSPGSGSPGSGSSGSGSPGSAVALALRSPFVFAVCQLGAEVAAKAEVARLRPHWRLAFSRPGLLTWKCEPAVAPDEALAAVFVRAYGVSLGRAGDAAELAALLRRTPGLLEAAAGSPLRLHVFERDRAKPGDEAPGDSYGPFAAAVRKQLLAALPAGLLGPEPTPRLGDLVLDVVVAAPGAAGDAEPWLVGLHTHGPGRSVHPGGRVPLQLPPDAPSRAWLKLEEGLVLSGLPLRPGEVAVEIGSAPGGASWALLQRGLRVIGVDPGEMAESVLRHPRFTHLKQTLGELRREQLPRRVDWLLLDVNLAPQVALHQVRRVVSTLRDTLRGALLTLKLNDWQLAAQVPQLLARVQAMGFVDVQARQLATNRQELCVAALMPAAAGRARPLARTPSL